MTTTQLNLQAARTAMNNFLSLFGGNDDVARAASIQAAGSVAVQLSVSDVSAAAMYTMMRDLLEQPDKLVARGLVDEANAVRYIIVLATAGGFVARATVETVMLNELKEGGAAS